MSIICLNHSRVRMNDGKNYTMSLVSCESPLHEGDRNRLIRKNYAGRTDGEKICMKCKDRHYVGKNNKNNGRPVSEKEKARIRLMNVGRKASEETKKKMSDAHSGEKNHMYGKPGTWLGIKRPEHAKKLSGANNYNYNPNLTLEHRLIGRNMPEVKIWADKVKSDCRWRCVCCCKRGYLNSHHLYNWKDFESQRFIRENGKALCVPCHKAYHKAHGKKNNTPEQFYKWLFEQILKLQK